MYFNRDSEQGSAAVEWYDSALGHAIIESEISAINRLLPSRFYRVCVQVEGPSHLNYLTGTDSLLQCRASSLLSHKSVNPVIAQAEWLPFEANSIDLLMLPHVLEFSEHPHDVLREASECVAANGVLMIVGFNPQSMLNLTKRMGKFKGTTLDEAELHPVFRVRDWLTLLYFEVFAGEYTFFRPPVRQVQRLRRLQSLEPAGARWWPALGSVYILAARKREAGIRLKPKLQEYGLKHGRFGLEY